MTSREIALPVEREFVPARGHLVAIEGGNFSGRTSLIRYALGQVRGEAAPVGLARTAYIGPEVYNALSGLGGTVRSEIRLHDRRGAADATVAQLLDDTGLAGLQDRNPFTLSGGEQACLAFASAIALRPEMIGLDCALEQVAVPLKRRLIDVLREVDADGVRTVVADNRLDECGDVGQRVRARDFTVPPIEGRVLGFDPINGDVPLATSEAGAGTLELDGVTFAYGSAAPVLRGASASLPGGSVYVLDGMNGAGKSTLAKLLCGCLRPSSGRLRLAGREYRAWRTPGHLVAYHFQNPDVQIFSTSVEQEVGAGLRPPRAGTGRASEVLENVLRTFGLVNVRREHPLDLPFVMRKRVALAATVAMGCPWVIFDEPSLGQDESASREIAAMIRRLAGAGTGLIVISHSPTFRALLGAKVLQLESGQLRS